MKVRRQELKVLCANLEVKDWHGSVNAKMTEDSCYLDCSKEFFKPEFKITVLLRKEGINQHKGIPVIRKGTCQNSTCETFARMLF